MHENVHTDVSDIHTSVCLLQAVVVLKGSKQLNVVVRKHAGLPLFVQRQQTSSSRSSQASGSSHQYDSASAHSSQRYASRKVTFQDR
ncbi:hypothetical protein BaRGS_00032932 [Batillaria attramentaria]|uniref:Uncharacterized protein n=1 Tax=Batillaria attramentaria TaxID=370345 RepID=A0ABD0JM77_9CAEN